MLAKIVFNEWDFFFRHPLFPLLALLFERCEQATQLAETPNSESFNMDIQAFVQHQERDRKPFLVNDAEIDGLVGRMDLFSGYLCLNSTGLLFIYIIIFR